ncbi:hypothetical protein SAMN05421835_103260 [Amycolatopsis sacchari]|uniref:Uncharacterized protein n=1 Tax=Amycolatopsis sacchari TaxID=115433 RepID=A0A1I3P347_9PSEU|nr:hypothetical protein SAMN05421835_103260 [Amycolatopsis sacchari]
MRAAKGGWLSAAESHDPMPVVEHPLVREQLGIA